MVLRPLLLRWQTEGEGWFFREYWFASLGYADHILIFSENKDDVESRTCLTMGLTLVGWLWLQTRHPGKMTWEIS